MSLDIQKLALTKQDINTKLAIEFGMSEEFANNLRYELEAIAQAAAAKALWGTYDWLKEYSFDHDIGYDEGGAAIEYAARQMLEALTAAGTQRPETREE